MVTNSFNNADATPCRLFASIYQVDLASTVGQMELIDNANQHGRYLAPAGRLLFTGSACRHMSNNSRESCQWPRQVQRGDTSHVPVERSVVADHMDDAVTGPESDETGQQWPR